MMRARADLLDLKAVIVLVLLALSPSPRAGAESFSGTANFDQRMIADVVGSALAFMAPRILDPQSHSQLAIWGLRPMSLSAFWLRPSNTSGRSCHSVPRDMATRPMRAPRPLRAILR